MKKMMLVMVFVVMAALVINPGMSSVVMAQSQAKCPVMGYKVDDKISTEYKGKRVAFCCKECIEKFKAEPEKYMKKLDAEGTPANTSK